MLLVRHFPVARRSFHPFSTEAVGFIIALHSTEAVGFIIALHSRLKHFWIYREVRC
jgi:hypothetical protein